MTNPIRTPYQEKPMDLYKKIETQDIVFFDSIASTDSLYSGYSVLLKKRGLIQSEDKIKRLFIKRENVQSTAIGRGTAIPHIFSEEFQHFTIGLAIIRNGMEFKAPDNEPVYAVFLIMSDERSVGQHLKTLAYIARLAQDSEFVDRIRTTASAEEALSVLREAENGLKK